MNFPYFVPPSIGGNIFETERFIIALLSPSEGRQLAEVLLQDEPLAARVPWLTEKNRDAALREAYGVQLHISAGQIKMWGIISRELKMPIGAILARNSLEGIDVEALVASQYWGAGVIEEAGEPVIEWLEDNSDIEIPVH